GLPRRHLVLEADQAVDPLHAAVRTAALLHDVGELVGERRRVGDRLAAAEEHVAAEGEGPRRHAPVELVGLAVVVDPHVAEVTPEGRLHRRPYMGRQRAATGTGPPDPGIGVVVELPTGGADRRPADDAAGDAQLAGVG